MLKPPFWYTRSVGERVGEWSPLAQPILPHYIIIIDKLYTN